MTSFTSRVLGVNVPVTALTSTGSRMALERAVSLASYAYLYGCSSPLFSADYIEPHISDESSHNSMSLQISVFTPVSWGCRLWLVIICGCGASGKTQLQLRV